MEINNLLLLGHAKNLILFHEYTLNKLFPHLVTSSSGSEYLGSFGPETIQIPTTYTLLLNNTLVCKVHFWNSNILH